MDRRRFLLTWLASAFAAPLVAESQVAEKVYRMSFPGEVYDLIRPQQDDDEIIRPSALAISRHASPES